MTLTNDRNRFMISGAIGLIWLANVGHGVKLIVEQRSRPFLEHYRDGQYAAAAARELQQLLGL